MRFVDVNILVYAHRAEAPRHDEFRAWIEEAMVAAEPLGVADNVLAGFIRVVTHPRVFRDPSPADVALEFADTVRTAPSALHVVPGPRTWPIFETLVLRCGATGNLAPDALLAAIAVEKNATLVSADRNFARFPDLRWIHPLDT